MVDRLSNEGFDGFQGCDVAGLADRFAAILRCDFMTYLEHFSAEEKRIDHV